MDFILLLLKCNLSYLNIGIDCVDDIVDGHNERTKRLDHSSRMVLQSYVDLKIEKYSV